MVSAESKNAFPPPQLGHFGLGSVVGHTNHPTSRPLAESCLCSCPILCLEPSTASPTDTTTAGLTIRSDAVENNDVTESATAVIG